MASDAQAAADVLARAAANKDLIRGYFDAMAHGTVEEALEFWAADATNYASGRHGQHVQSGRERLAMTFSALRIAFPDRRWEIDDLIADGDRVVCRMTVSGTFGTTPDPPAMPLPPGWVGVEGTRLVPASAGGKPYSVKHVHVFRVRDGVITDHWAARDDLGLVIQLGGIVPPG